MVSFAGSDSAGDVRTVSPCEECFLLMVDKGDVVRRGCFLCSEWKGLGRDWCYMCIH